MIGLMNFIFTALTVFYCFVMAYAVFSCIINKPFSKVFYTLTCYSLSLLCIYRVLTLFRVGSILFSFIDEKSLILKTLSRNKTFKSLQELINFNESYIFKWFFICIALYLLTLFVIKMTTSINAYRIKNIIYVGLLVFASYKVAMQPMNIQSYVSLMIFAVILYVVSIFLSNFLTDLRNSFKKDSNRKRKLNDKVDESKSNNDKICEYESNWDKILKKLKTKNKDIEGEDNIDQ